MAKAVLIDVTAITWNDTKLRDELKEALEEEGYTFDGEGIKAFLVEALLTEEDEEVNPGSEIGKLLVEQASRFIQNNPDAVSTARARAGSLFHSIMSKLKK